MDMNGASGAMMGSAWGVRTLKWAVGVWVFGLALGVVLGTLVGAAVMYQPIPAGYERVEAAELLGEGTCRPLAAGGAVCRLVDSADARARVRESGAAFTIQGDELVVVYPAEARDVLDVALGLEVR